MPVPFEGAPAVFPLALFDEGHTDVALFMVLSGYLFVKLLDGKEISYPAFFWNRFVRLAPLLIVVFVLKGIQIYLTSGNLTKYFSDLYFGFFYPTWPNGGWSISIELQFYILLPLLLYLSRYSRLLPLVIILYAIVFRIYLYKTFGGFQKVIYHTLGGHIDQFVFGMVASFYAKRVSKHSFFLCGVFLIFMIFYWWFDATGGFYLPRERILSGIIWICLPTIEGLGYAALIILYESRKINNSTWPSRILQRFGEYSYSIYLLHFFFVFEVAKYIHFNIMDISNFYIGLIWAAAFYIAMLIPGYFSYRFIESPFLKLRRKYIKEPKKSSTVADLSIESESNTSIS